MQELDEVDRGILRRLQEDARVAFREIADELGVSESTVFVRVKKLQERGVIRGFSASEYHSASASSNPSATTLLSRSTMR